MNCVKTKIIGRVFALGVRRADYYVRCECLGGICCRAWSWGQEGIACKDAQGRFVQGVRTGKRRVQSVKRGEHITTVLKEQNKKRNEAEHNMFTVEITLERF